MWNCPECGCLGIAASLTWCPMCGKERNMPMCTVNSGASNANAVEGETGYVAPAEPAAVVAEVTPEAAAEPVAGTEAPEAAEPVQAVSAAPQAAPAKVPPKVPDPAEA